MASVLSRATAWQCRLPMPHPVRLGAMTYPTRDYVVLEVEARDGRVGSALGYIRGTPVLEATRLVAAALDPGLVDDPEAATADIARRFAPGWAALVRGASLIDIALWDLAAQGAGRSVGEQLGGSVRAESRWMFVAGYFPVERGLDALVEEAVHGAGRGAAIVKVMLSVDRPADDALLLRELRAALAPEVAVAIDLHGACREPEEAAAVISALEPHGLLFAEDPFPGHDLRRLRRLAELTSVPLAVGEDLVEVSAIDDLLEVAGFLRVDATASGGLSFARRAVLRAEAVGRLVLPHVFEPVHAALPLLSEAVLATERIPAAVGADPFERLLAPVAAERTGGLSLVFDRRALGAAASECWTLEL